MADVDLSGGETIIHTTPNDHPIRGKRGSGEDQRRDKSRKNPQYDLWRVKAGHVCPQEMSYGQANRMETIVEVEWSRRWQSVQSVNSEECDASATGHNVDAALR